MEKSRKFKKVDFHSHYIPPTYSQYLDEYEEEKPDRFATPEWSLEDHIKQMNRLGIAFSFLSISSPNLSKAPKEVEIEFVHKINMEGAGYVKKYPQRLGLYASLPLPHVKAAIDEAEYAIKNYSASGFALSTNYAGIYLGDPSYDSLMDFMDSNGCVIAIHPTAAPVEPDINKNVPIPAMEFMIETTRTFMNMEMHNIFTRYPNIKWIFPHAGAFISILSDRIEGFAVIMKKDNPDLKLNFKEDMRHVYFDCAGFPLQKQLDALLSDVTAKNLLFGSDTPYTPNVACMALSGGIESFEHLSLSDKRSLFYMNAVKLHPELAATLHVQPPSYGTVCYADNPLTLKEKISILPRTFISKIYGKVF